MIAVIEKENMDDSMILMLPVEVLKFIGHYLHPCDLLAVSGTCHALRSVLNDNLIWQKYTDGGDIGRRLGNVTSVVMPEFAAPQQLSTLEPLCQHRLYFMRKSRLFHNLRNGKCVRHTKPFNGYFADFETHKGSRSRQITYADEYLFTFSYNKDGISEIIHILNIKDFPYLFMTLELEKHVHEYCVIISQQVIKDKLIVRQDHWIDVYKINFPHKSIPLLQTINMFSNEFVPTDNPIKGNFLCYSSIYSDCIHIWNVDTVEQCKDIPRNSICGNEYRVLSCTENFDALLLSTQVTEGNKLSLFVYNMLTQSYENFNVVIHSEHDAFRGHIDNVCSFVVIILAKENAKCSVRIFEIGTSIQISEKNGLDLSNLDFVTMKNSNLFLPSEFSILIFKLTSLETMHELHFNTNSLINEIPPVLLNVEYIHFSKLCLMIVISKVDECEIWNFEQMSKLDAWNAMVTDVANTVSKLICYSEGRLTVANYW